MTLSGMLVSYTMTVGGCHGLSDPFASFTVTAWSQLSCFHHQACRRIWQITACTGSHDTQGGDGGVVVAMQSHNFNAFLSVCHKAVYACISATTAAVTLLQRDHQV